MKRVIIGTRGSDNGMWISKPGKDAASTSDDDMLVSPSRFLVQPFMQGHIYAPSNGGGYNGAQSNTKVSMVVTHNLGYIPVVEIFGSYQNGNVDVLARITTTTVTFNNVTSGDNSFMFQGQGAPGGTYYFAVDITYVIFRTQLSVS